MSMVFLHFSCAGSDSGRRDRLPCFWRRAQVQTASAISTGEATSGLLLGFPLLTASADNDNMSNASDY